MTDNITERCVWEEPVRGDLFPREYLGLSGIEQLRLFLAGNVGDPPIGRLTGMHLTEVGTGSATGNWSRVVDSCMVVAGSDCLRCSLPTTPGD